MTAERATTVALSHLESGFISHPDGTYDCSVRDDLCHFTEEDCLATHPGFDIACRKCQSRRVYFENGMGWSAESGRWGTMDLVCVECGAGVELVD